MKAPTKPREPEVKWLDYVLMAVGGSAWKSIFEVRERIDQLLPPHAIYRKRPQYNRRHGTLAATVTSLKLTVIGSTIRYAMRTGVVERSVPITPTFPRNIGNYYIRLTPVGKGRLKRIKRYICNECLHTGITRPRVIENAICGHCHSRHLRFY